MIDRCFLNNASALPNMRQRLFPSLLISLLLSLSVARTSCQQQCANTKPRPVRAGYWLPSSNRFSPISNINASLYTHLYYYSLTIDEATSLVAVPPEQVSLLSSFSTTLKSSNPSIKTLLSIASDDHQPNVSNSAFSTMAANPTLRSAFINSTIALSKEHAFDGLDLAWQFPALSSDMANLGTLLAEWRTRISEETRNSSSTLLLTATVYFSDHVFDNSSDNLDYPIDSISNNLDWANAFSFGYHKNGEMTVADAPLYDKFSHFSISYGISSWLDAGLPSCKLVMGIPLYGRSWFLKNKEKNGLGSQVVAAGPRQKLSNQTGIMAYFEIKKILADNNLKVVYDNQTSSSYFRAGGVWVSFDNGEVLKEKIDFALQNGLQGYFLWPISFDDSNYTISKQVMDTWLQDEAFIHVLTRQIPNPAGISAGDLAEAVTQTSSGSRQSFPTIFTFHMHAYSFLLFLCYLTV